MALNDEDIHRTGTRPGSMGNHPRASGSFVPYIVGAVILAAVFFIFFGGSATEDATIPPTTTSVPQTIPAPVPPATK